MGNLFHAKAPRRKEKCRVFAPWRACHLLLTLQNA